MAMLDVKETPRPHATIETTEQARNFVLELIQDMQGYRHLCDQYNNQTTVRQKQKDLWCFLQKQGQVMGALKALHMVKKLDDRAFAELTQIAINALLPSNIKQGDN